MTALKIDYISEIALAYSVRGNLIVARRGPKHEVNPLEIHSTLYAHFAGLDDNPESFADFIRAFGPVTMDGFFNGDQIDNLIAIRESMAALMRVAADDPKNIANLGGWSSAERQRTFFHHFHSLDDDFTSEDFNRLVDGIGAGRYHSSSKPELSSQAANIQAVIRPGTPDGRPTLSLTPNT